MSDPRTKPEPKHVQDTNRQKELMDAYKRLAKTEDGQMVLRDIMEYCGFKNIATVLDSKTLQIDTVKTVYNDARREVWAGLRKKIPFNLLNQIEAERRQNDA